MARKNNVPRTSQVPELSNRKRSCLSVFLIFAFQLLAGMTVYGQKADTTADTRTGTSSDKITIHILNNRVVTFTKTDSGDFFRFIGDVVMQQGTDTLYCDSLIQNKTTNILEAFSNVRIAQEGGTQGLCDYLRYTASQKLAYMRGNVSLTDGKNKLWSDDLTYNLGTKIGVYNNNGTLEADSTIVTSSRGEYNVKSKEARFAGNAIIKDPQYHTKSDDMSYNTETKMTHFFAKSIVVGDSGRSILQTSGGYYDSHAGLAYFNTPSSLWYYAQYIEADTLYYNKTSGLGYAHGHVIAVDTSHHSTIYCGRATYYQKRRVMWAVQKPVLEQVNGRDTLYIRADTFYSAPMASNKILAEKTKTGDSTAANISVLKKNNTGIAEQPKKIKKKKQILLPETKTFVDTSAADSTAPLCFVGYHHVRIFSDSLQGVCDSISYTQSDSMMRMIYNPVAWSRNSQITGDTIIMQLDSSHIKSITVPNNAFIVSLAGPEGSGLYDQIQGRTLKGYFKKNTITNLHISPNAEAIYYTKDEHNAFLGVSEAKSVKMNIFFVNQKIKKILFEKDVHQKLTPLDKADLPNEKLSRFKWLIDRRPKSKEELFD